MPNVISSPSTSYYCRLLVNITYPLFYIQLVCNTNSSISVSPPFNLIYNSYSYNSYSYKALSAD